MTFIPNDDFILRIAQGLVPGHSLVTKFGRNGDVDAAEDVIAGGGPYAGQPTGSPETVEVFSSDANDTSAGTGMQSCRIFGLKTSSSTAYESEDITLNGVTGEDSASTWYRINRCFGLSYGSGGTNAGSITLRHKTTTANVFAVIQAGKGQTQVCCYTIPDAVTGYLVGRYIAMSKSAGAAGSAEVTLRVREFGAGGYRAALNYDISTYAGVEGPAPLPVILPAQSDIKLTVDSVSSVNTQVVGELSIVLIDDD